MNSLHRVSGPIKWSAPSDTQVQRAIANCADLHNRARTAAEAARGASERIAEAARAHAQRRAQELAAGRDDIGDFDAGELDYVRCVPADRLC